jgi:hypothetical protein
LGRGGWSRVHLLRVSIYPPYHVIELIPGTEGAIFGPISVAVVEEVDVPSECTTHYARPALSVGCDLNELMN